MRRQGKVASIRILPIDCLGVIDVCESIGIDTSTLTFPAIVSQALRSLLKAHREMGTIPTRKGFEWDHMMGQVKKGWTPENDPRNDISALIPSAINRRSKTEGLVQASKLSREDLKEFELLSEWRDGGPLAPEMEENYQRLLTMGQPS